MRDKPYPKGKFGRNATEIDDTFRRRWCDMKSRLRRDKGYKNKKCLRKNFSEFYVDMYDSYVEHYKLYGKHNTTLDRIDSNGDYCKENCRRATSLQQSQNRNYNVNYTICGETHCITERLRVTGLSFYGFKSKMELLQSGEITEEEFLNKEYKPKSQAYLVIGGKRYSALEIQQQVGLTRSSLNYRYKRFLSGKISEKELFAPPKKSSVTTQQKVEIDGKEYLISELSRLGNVTRDTVAIRYNRLQNNKITKEKFKQRFNIL